MGCSLDMLKRVDFKQIPKSQAPFRFCSSSQVGKLRNKHNHIVMYSRGALYLGVSWNRQLIRIALLLMASNTDNSHYYDFSLGLICFSTVSSNNDNYSNTSASLCSSGLPRCLGESCIA
jgi:hypothetical protein